MLRSGFPLLCVCRFLLDFDLHRGRYAVGSRHSDLDRAGLLGCDFTVLVHRRDLLVAALPFQFGLCAFRKQLQFTLQFQCLSDRQLVRKRLKVGVLYR